MVNQYASTFNRSQSKYRLIPRNFKNYETLLKTWHKTAPKERPTLVQLELTNYSALAARDELYNLDAISKQLPKTLTADLHPQIWQLGHYQQKRYAFPWNISVPALLYNAGIVKKAPRTWNELKESAAQLKTKQRKPLLITADTWTFENHVLSSGGKLNKDTQPQLNNTKALEILHDLQKMQKNGSGQLRTKNEVARSSLDFVTGKHLFVFASVANWSDARKFPLFSLGVAPFPCSHATCRISLGGGVLSIKKTASASEVKGAVAAWQFLMHPKIQSSWTKHTAYLPLSRSAEKKLQSWYNQNEQLKLTHQQIHRAQARPQLASYNAWMSILEKQLLQAFKHNTAPDKALNKAQQQAKTTQIKN